MANRRLGLGALCRNLGVDGQLSAFGVVALASYLPGGLLADRFSARRLMSIALVTAGRPPLVGNATLAVAATGVGLPVIDYLLAQRPSARLVPIVITGSGRARPGYRLSLAIGARSGRSRKSVNLTATWRLTVFTNMTRALKRKCWSSVSHTALPTRRRTSRTVVPL